MDRRNQLRVMYRYATIGLEFIFAFGVCLAAGFYADRRLGGGIAWTLLGGAVGFLVGMYRLIQGGRQYHREIEREDDE